MTRFSQDHVRGWLAAQASLPFDRTETEDWRAGFALFIGTVAQRRRNACAGFEDLVH